MRPDHYKLMYEFVQWAGTQSQIEGIALVGPCADDENEENANLSFLLITDKKNKTIEAILHQFPFEPLEQASVEEHGMLSSIKAVYASGIDADYGVAGEEWLRHPLEGELGAALSMGFKVIWESEGLFDGLHLAIANYVAEQMLS
ncbi:hypothetical protein FHS16_001985 [Paenibacillus endophyticus]|uniref:Uncharacterized protein n=1 Tax=Paenibacillus endophyticus TaxID=1294268 RepID=A0A7W5C8C3_9BACL|nr:hypothetical protein [Paenibacillus endophyticus]MBB3151939.1 hypothetical protein [Paenibacillus endophyticus]